MRQFIWYLLFGVMLFVSYQGWNNAQNHRETQGVARNAVCKALNQTPEACELAGDAEPSGHQTGVTGRVYQFVTKSATYLAECKREYVFAGQWSCVARPGSLL